jgi:hypothetical protein
MGARVAPDRLLEWTRYAANDSLLFARPQQRSIDSISSCLFAFCVRKSRAVSDDSSF